MITVDFKGKKLPLLGLGTMRFPLIEGSTDAKDIDVEKTAELIDTAMSAGVNYFDTAYPYHASQSEIVLGKLLSKYPRGSYYLATKFPGHQILSSYDPASVFEDQLRKCSVDYFDFYLLHNVYENSIDTYNDPKWGIIDYFVKQKREGRIKHLGFSSHGGVELLRRFLDQHGDNMEFCQIQLNYLDWTLQDAKEKCRLLDEYNIPIWVMEPVRGGKLATLREEDTRSLMEIHPDWSSAEWAFRWLQGVDNVKMILSGMTTVDQLRENINTFSNYQKLTNYEQQALYKIADKMRDTVPCTACRYCTEGCPQGIDIPEMLANYNEICFSPSFNIGMRMDAVPEGRRAQDCIGCNRCTSVCPQKIDIPSALSDFTVRLEKLPKWADICREREKAAKGAK
ncbi:MAG: oxidoreductase [Ruminococcaceae bacterium]|nr:oxidoreductase [Oscillospiraceae bacterium]